MLPQRPALQVNDDPVVSTNLSSAERQPGLDQRIENVNSQSSRTKVNRVSPKVSLPVKHREVGPSTSLTASSNIESQTRQSQRNVFSSFVSKKWRATKHATVERSLRAILPRFTKRRHHAVSSKSTKDVNVDKTSASTSTESEMDNNASQTNLSQERDDDALQQSSLTYAMDDDNHAGPSNSDQGMTDQGLNYSGSQSNLIQGMIDEQRTRNQEIEDEQEPSLSHGLNDNTPQHNLSQRTLNGIQRDRGMDNEEKNSLDPEIDNDVRQRATPNFSEETDDDVQQQSLNQRLNDETSQSNLDLIVHNNVSQTNMDRRLDVHQRLLTQGQISNNICPVHVSAENVDAEQAPCIGYQHIHTTSEVLHNSVLVKQNVTNVYQSSHPLDKRVRQIGQTNLRQSPAVLSSHEETLPKLPPTPPLLSPSQTNTTDPQTESGSSVLDEETCPKAPVSHFSSGQPSSTQYRTVNFLTGVNMRNMLKKQARTIAGEESSLSEFPHRPMTPVKLSIASKSLQIDDAFLAEGHFHRRKELENLYEKSEGDLIGADLFRVSQEAAKQDAYLKFSAENVQEKRDYVQKHGNIVGVVGQAGIGKTTSIKKWALQALDEQIFGRTSYFFYIVIRFIDFTREMTLLEFLLSTMLPEWSGTSEEETFILGEIMRDPNVLLLFDGLDEAAFGSFSSHVSLPLLPFASKAENYLKHIIGGNLLKRARKIVTSRPTQLYNLHASYRPKFIAQILGLTPSSQDELGLQICGNKYNQIQQQLVQNRSVFAYCYVPVNFILTLNFLMIYKGEIQFVSLTRVLAFTCGQYSRTEHLKGQNCMLDKLAKMAWDGFLDERAVFYFTHFKASGIDQYIANAYLHTSVAMHVNLKLTILDGDKICYFSHLVWQEFFAAFYLMMVMPVEEFSDLCRHLRDNRWEVVAKFVFGICDRTVFDQLRYFVPMCPAKDWKAKKSLLMDHITVYLDDDAEEEEMANEIKRVCSWAHEANNPEMTTTILHSLPGVVSFRYSPLSPIDVENVSFVLQTAKDTSLKTLDLTGNDLSACSAASLARCVGNFQEVVLWKCKIASGGLKAFSLRIQDLQSPLKKLDISGITIRYVEADVLFACICNVEELEIAECKMEKKCIEILCAKIQVLKKTLKKLDLSYNPIGDTETEALAGCVHNIERLILRGCKMVITNVEKLTISIQFLQKPLKKLDLTKIKLGDEGTRFLSRCVHNTEELILLKCDIGCEGVKDLSPKILALPKPMKRLDLSWNYLTFGCAESLAACVHNIGVLDVRECDLTFAGEDLVRSRSLGIVLVNVLQDVSMPKNIFAIVATKHLTVLHPKGYEPVPIHQVFKISTTRDSEAG